MELFSQIIHALSPQILAILSAISAIGSFISLFVDIKNKPVISFRLFILLISIALLFWACFLAEEPIFAWPDVQISGTETRPLPDYEDISPVTTVPPSENPPAVLPSPDTPEFLPVFGENADAVITAVSGAMTYENEVHQYSFTPSASGLHRLELSAVTEDTDYTLRLEYADGEYITHEYYASNADGISFDLDAGTQYHIDVIQGKGFGSYQLNICYKKSRMDISAYTCVADAVVYTDQQNDYAFIPETSGIHRFELADAAEDMEVTITLYDSDWAYMTTKYYAKNGDGVSFHLDAGERYYIRISQYRNLGNYVLYHLAP